MTIDAVKSTIDDGSPIIASVGMNTWELVLWAVGEFGGSAIVICPLRSSESPDECARAISTDFNLDPEGHAWVFLPSPENPKSKKFWWDTRDRLAFDLAHRIMPIAIRSGGRLENFIGHEIETDPDLLDIDERYRIDHVAGPNSGLKINLPSKIGSFDNWNFLTHWTRRFYGPWPGERSADYYRAIANSDSSYPRSAASTLRRILTENKLRASGDHIRDSSPVVAFTACNPSESLPLMRWRKRYVRPTFEPYGIAIHYRAALKMGIRPVTYVKSDTAQESGHPNHPELTQGYGIGDWPMEREWRAMGDVDLSRIPLEDVIVLVPTEQEVMEFQNATEFVVKALEVPERGIGYD